MAVDIFTKQQFERKVMDKTNSPYECLGLVQGEYTYKLPIKNRPDINIIIRSSIDVSGRSANTGEDSIRAYLHIKNRGHMGKTQKWVTRVAGWDVRTLKMLREIYKNALDIENCPKCNTRMGIYKSTSENNKGRIFTKCWDCDVWGDWID